MPKSYKVVLNDYDRVYWLNILIACEGKVAGEINEEIRSRSNVVLTNAINDLEAFVEFYSPPMFGDPLAIDHHKIARSAGYFMHTERLFNPTLQDFKYAIESAKKWVRLNQSDPEFKSLQINVCFAGHGGYDNNGNGVVEFKNTDMSAQELASSIFSILPSKSICDNRHRVDLFFDCCHAGAFALDFLKVVKQTNPKMVSQNKAEEYDDGAPIGGIGLGRIFCSSMHDEESLEEDLYQHGLFTYAFLNEFSAKNVRKNGMPNLGLKDVGWYSGGRQHPFFISFLKGQNPKKEDFLIKFPSLKYLTWYRPDELKNPQNISFPEGTITDDGLILDGKEFFKSQLNTRREMVKQTETELTSGELEVVGVSNEDYSKQEIYWF